ncbi:MAG: DNA helicase RecQ [Spirochaetia bacterium]|nr:DNA helicase RecQ [Spirochaetia bacterium]
MLENTVHISCHACTGLSPETVLKSVFGYSSFRPLQKEIIQNVCSGRDTLAIMPTGGGKSLTYQIPALIFDGLTVVVSPLIALMHDQVSSLASNGIEAVFLNSSLEWEEYKSCVARVLSGKVKIVYVSPEGLATQKIQTLLHNENLHIKCFTIDEAHCISEWGHDFRPDYLAIASVRRQFPQAVCLALTATATKHVRDDIVNNLQMKNPDILLASFNRPNIFLEVRPKRDSYVQIVSFLKEHLEDSGIIYCFSRKQVDQLADLLSNDGFSVLPYHAGLDDSTREKNQTAFIRDKVQIMVATVAFGMGIDKPNVRFVIHYDLPKSLEQYYQEIGRAGRDGLPSTALLLYSSSDIHKIRYFFADSADVEKSEKLLQSMVDYASARHCRRQKLLAYFGEFYTPESSSAENKCCCDICSTGQIQETDVTIPVQKFLSCIYRLNQRFGTLYVIDVLLGSRQKRIMDNGHNMLSTWGIGTELSREDWFELASILTERNYIEKSMEYSILSVTAKGRELLATREKVFLPVVFTGRGAKKSEASAKKSKPEFALHKKGSAFEAISDTDAEGLRICNALKEWRKKTADKSNVPPYVIFGDKTLVEIALKKPQTSAELLEIYGLGDAKVRKFSSAILKIIRA